MALLLASAELLASVGMTSRARAEETLSKTWNFDSDTPGSPPTGFSFGRTGKGALGRWIVQTVKDAPSGALVLAQTDTDSTDYRFPVAIADAPSLANLRVSVRCKPLAGEVDRACGLVFRYQDENNSYVTRANAREDNVNRYSVTAGRRKQVAGWRGKVTSDAWHELRVEAIGNQFTVSWDGQRVLQATDNTFAQAGRVGLWTKADSVTEFDDLSVTAISGP